MGFFRSELMKLYQITIPKDDAWNISQKLGDMDSCHFIDLNKNEQPFQLPYTARIKLCDDTERRLIYLMNECKTNRIRIRKPQSVEIFNNNIRAIREQKRSAMDLLFDALDSDVREKEKFVASQSKTIKEMQDNINKMKDFKQVMDFVVQMTPQMGNIMPNKKKVADEENSAALLDQAEAAVNNSLYSFAAGTIKANQKEFMKRLLFRITRGKALTYFDDFDQEGETKSVYLVVYQESELLRERVQRVCDSFQGQRFEVPPLEQIHAQAKETEENIVKATELLAVSQKQLKDYLRSINKMQDDQGNGEVASTLEVYKWFVAKEKSIYSMLNMLRQGQSTYIGYFWAPIELEAKINDELREFPSTELQPFNEDGQLNLKPPTHFKTNDVTYISQLITDTYGVPEYREANPSTYNVVTFPFLFAVMFGDYGHGSLLFFAGLVLVLGAEKIRQTPAAPALMGRYLLLMMGFFSMFTGLLYNEFFAIPNDWFGTCYNINDPRTTEQLLHGGTYTYINGQDGFNTCAYPFGFDPAWFNTGQQLAFSNNVKMKLAVILGVAHMTLGIVTKGTNTIFFGDYMAFVFEVITGLIILLGLFGWMDILIFAKWFYVMNPDSDNDVMQAKINLCPSIITSMINNFLKLAGSFGDQNEIVFFWSQNSISSILIVCAVICMPLMLCVKPIAYATCLKEEDHINVKEFDQIEAQEEEQRLMVNKSESNNSSIVGKDNIQQIRDILEKEQEPGHHGGFGEMFIHQMIETIEFVLGTVSNTASYLRLWALSLAHSQLALVFLTQVLNLFWKPSETTVNLETQTQEYDSAFKIGILTFFLWFAFMTVTFAVLMVMDVLECFLHTLRLHWVEFQNKFFKGTGYLYTPFSFEKVFIHEMSRSL